MRRISSTPLDLSSSAFWMKPGTCCMLHSRLQSTNFTIEFEEEIRKSQSEKVEKMQVVMSESNYMTQTNSF